MFRPLYSSLLLVWYVLSYAPRVLTADKDDLSNGCSISMSGGAHSTSGDQYTTMVDTERVSRIECALLCLHHHSCTQVQYSPSRGRCLVRGSQTVSVAARVLAPPDARTLALNSHRTVQNTCPDGFAYIGTVDVCFKAVTDKLRTYSAAQQYCRSMGSGYDLLVTESELKYWVTGEIVNSIMGLTGVFWIGGRMTDSGQWRWTPTGQQLAAELLAPIMWAPYEPDNLSSGGNTCLQSVFDPDILCENGCLGDQACQTEAYFFCEHRPCHA